MLYLFCKFAPYLILSMKKACLLLATIPFITSAFAGSDTTAAKFGLHFQATYIYQYKPGFAAAYSGANSIKAAEEKENSVTATIFAGVRLWRGAELYIDPEIAGGSGLSGAFGLAASTNGETFRVGNPSPTLYIGRGFITQTLPLGTKKEAIDEDDNELGGNKTVDYVKFYLGKLSLGDLFDNNAYANSPRTQFLNWCLMNNGAYDYAANVRGYTYVFAGVVKVKEMTYKAALATLPVTANAADLNTDLSEEYSLNAEVTHTHKIGGQPGSVRFLVYRNTGHMGSYEQAMLVPVSGVPDITATRQYGRAKNGFGLNADQQINSAVGVFARVGWNDGRTETWAFTEADRSVSAGVSLDGRSWSRAGDNIGFAVVANGLSKDHRDYLNAGGLGFQLGDGKLSYGYETAAELYYSYKPIRTGIWFTADDQVVLNPGYNKDRGPLNVLSVRLHVEL